MDIQIHNDITNKKLVDSWKAIVEKNGYLPQSTYEWCATWWKHFSDSKTKLHIITVLEDSDIIGIAPMFIIKNFLNKQLKFIGTGLTDFHELLIAKSKYEDVFNQLLEYFNSFNKWDVVLFDQINNELSDYNYLLGNSIKNKFVIECPIIDITNTSWDGYIKNLNSKNQRKMIRRRIKEYEDQNFTFQKITEENVANLNIKELIYTHINRWNQEQMDSKFKKSNYSNFVVEVFYQMLKSHLAVCYVVKNNAEIVSYILGFITNKIYYVWNTSFNPKYSNHSPGLIIEALTIMDLIENQYRQFHFMRGGYDYKKRWMMKGHDHISQNYLFLLSKPNLKGKVIENYYLDWRDQIKKKFNRIILNRNFRKLAGLP